MDDNVPFPATPTRKKRRTDASVNVTSQAGVSDIFPTKCTIDGVTTTLDVLVSRVNTTLLTATSRVESWVQAKVTGGTTSAN